MTITIDLHNACHAVIPQKIQFQKWAEIALHDVADDCAIAICLVDEKESAALNASYRDKPYATNILSFPCQLLIDITPRLLGDLVICAELVEKEAAQQQKPSHHHFAHLVIHGCLHLLGYDHRHDEEAAVMESLEMSMLAKLNIANPY